MSDSVTKQLKGTSDGEMVDGDWSTFHVNIGRQYPVKLKTKVPEIKELARAAGKQEAVWTYQESEGNPNPHRPGTHYMNRYLSKVEVGGVLDETLAGQQQLNVSGSKPGSPKTDVERISIERQTAIKAAVPVLGLFPDRAQFWEFVQEMEAFFQQERGARPASASTTGPTFIPTGEPEQDDSDIPF